MKDQHNMSRKRSGLLAMALTVVLLVATVFCLTLSTSAASAQTVLNIRADNLTVTGAELTNGRYTKTYDGRTDGLTVTLKNPAEAGIASGDDVTVSFTAAFTNANAGNCEIVVTPSLSGADAYKYAEPAIIRLPATINPVVLEWVDGGNASIQITYDPTKTAYELDRAAVQAALPSLKNVSADVLASLNITVTDVTALGAVNASETPYDTVAKVDLGNTNYTVGNVPVKVTVNPIVIDSIVWGGNTSWTYGDANNVSVVAYSGSTAYNILTITCSDENYWAGNAGSYALLAELNDNVNFKLGTSQSANTSHSVTILKKKYTVSMSDLVVIGDGKTAFHLSVEGNLPEEIRSRITYTVDGVAFAGRTDFGKVTVLATLPTDNYTYDTPDAADISTLQATLTINRQEKAFPVYDEAGNQVGTIILVNRNGFSDDVVATVTAIKGYPDIVKNTRISQVYKIVLSGVAEGESFSIIIPIADNILAKGCDELTLDHLCMYESATDTLIPVNKAGKGYTVVLGQGYYQVDGFTGNTEITFTIAPDYNVNFFLTAPGILLIILLVIAFLVGLFYIGLFLRRNLRTRENPALLMDTDGVLPEHEPIEVEARPEVDEDAALAATADQIAESLDVEAEEEELVADETELAEAYEESMNQLLTEAAEVELEVVYEDGEELADQIAEELDETLTADDALVADEEELAAVVEEVKEEALAEETEAEEAEESEDNDNDDDDDDDGSAEAFAFGSSAGAINFIDVKENPETYQEMLERQSRGEIRIVDRYKKSFKSKLIQSQGNVQAYYSEIKNALLAFKGVKCRTSWGYEAFNKGRAHVAKIDAKTKTLYLYLAINPEELAETKYNFVDVSSKKKYASTPVLMKIKGERKFKHALELIAKICGEQMELPRIEAEPVDYTVPFMTVDEMVEAGIMKHYAGYIVIEVESEPEAIAVSEEIVEAVETVAEATEEVADEAVETVADTTETTEA